MPGKIDNLLADFPHAHFKLTGRFTTAAFRADFFAQSISLRVELLQCGLIFSSLRIDAQKIIDLCFLGSAARSQPAFHEVGLFANETNVEHGAKCRGRRPRQQIYCSGGL